MPFAKLFVTPHGQLLVTHEYDEQHPEGHYRLSMRGEGFEGVDPAVHFRFYTEEERDDAFDRIGQLHADATAAKLSKTVRQMVAPTVANNG